MARDSWARSGARPAVRSGRPAGSWVASVARARSAWDDLTSCRGVGAASGVTMYSDVAAAAILATALGLWSDTAVGMGSDDNGSGD